MSDCTPASIELEGNNDYLKILRRLVQTRVEAKKIDCDQRMKLALKSKINTAVGKTYTFSEPVWFKLKSSHKWRSGINLGQDGKVLFIKYANFIRRVALDHIIPADEYDDTNEEEVNKEDEDNTERLNDDKFESVEMILKKDKEIEELTKAAITQEKVIKYLQ